MKRFTTYKFARVFLDDLENFKWTFKTPSLKNDGTMNVQFDWDFNGYFGYGEIVYKNGKVMNESKNNNSSISIHSKCSKLSNAVKHVSPLYNEPELIVLFNYMLENSNLEG